MFLLRVVFLLRVSLWLFWPAPAVSLAARFPAGVEKRADGRLSPARFALPTRGDSGKAWFALVVFSAVL